MKDEQKMERMQKYYKRGTKDQKNVEIKMKEVRNMERMWKLNERGTNVGINVEM